MTREVECPACGCKFEAERTNRKGTGADVSKIKRIGIARLEVIKILQLEKVYYEDQGLTAREIGQRFRERQKVTEQLKATKAAAEGRSYRIRRLSTDHSIGGRISECNVLKIIDTDLIQLTQYVPESEARWGFKREPKYWLTDNGKLVPNDIHWNPHSGSETITESPVTRPVLAQPQITENSTSLSAFFERPSR